MKHDVSFRFAPGRDMFLTIDDLRRGVDCPSKMTCRIRIRIQGVDRNDLGKKLPRGLAVLRHC